MQRLRMPKRLKVWEMSIGPEAKIIRQESLLMITSLTGLVPYIHTGSDQPIDCIAKAFGA